MNEEQIKNIKDLYTYYYMFADWSIVQEDILNNRDTPAEILDMLYESHITDMRVIRGVSSHPNTSAARLTRLAGDTNEAVRWGVSDNPNTPPQVLSMLAADMSNVIRFRVAQNPNTPISDLKALSRESNKNVRSGVAANENTPTVVLLALASDPDEAVRLAVAQNPASVQAALERLRYWLIWQRIRPVLFGRRSPGMLPHRWSS